MLLSLPYLGKTTFLFYLLLYRLENKLPTAVQLDGTDYIIFDEQGAKVNSLPHKDPRLQKCWALTDSNANNSQPCEAFQSLAKLVILTSPPEPERWRMDKTGRWSTYHLRSALGTRDSCNCVSWLSSHQLDFPAHEAYRKTLRKRQTQPEKQRLYDPSSTLSLVRKWGPSTRNILRSMRYAALGDVNPIEMEAESAAIRICNNPLVTLEKLSTRTSHIDVFSVIFLRRAANVSVQLDEGQTFIPTPHLQAIFEKERLDRSNGDRLDPVYAISSRVLW